MNPIHFAKGSDTTIEGWGMPFFGPFAGDDGVGRDFDGEFFSPKTDFLFDWFKGERPLLYQHTWDAKVGTDALGGVVTHEKRKDGIWVQAQLDLRSKWYEAIRELIGNEALSFSSGAYPAGVVVAKSGEILRWPWVELTATPTPANPYASIAAMKAMDWPPLPEETIVVPEVIETPTRQIRIVGVKAAWSASYINALPDSAFACKDASGRHYPHHDASGKLDMPHLRNAMSRIGDPANVQCGKRHLMAHAEAEGMGS